MIFEMNKMAADFSLLNIISPKEFKLGFRNLLK